MFAADQGLVAAFEHLYLPRRHRGRPICGHSKKLLPQLQDAGTEAIVLLRLGRDARKQSQHCGLWKPSQSCLQATISLTTSTNRKSLELVKVDSAIPTFSAGGVLCRKGGKSVEIVVVQRRKGIETKWLPVLRQLPKGAVEDGEELQQTALREVQEETGFQGHIVGTAGEASWKYTRDGKTWQETVHYYLMKLASDTQLPHDDEFEEVLWMPIADAAKMLSYPEERSLLEQVIWKNILGLAVNY